MFRRKPTWQLLGFTLLLLCPGLSNAQVFLVGASYYSSAADGSSNGNYRFTTNSAGTGIRLNLDLNGNFQNNAISFSLSPGANNFTFSVPNNINPGSFGGLELFLNATGTSFNTGSNTGVAPHLAAFTPSNNSGAFGIPAAGIQVRSYDNSPFDTVPYSGATSFLVGDAEVTISAFASTNLPSGTFTISVASAVPEPATWMSLGSLAVVGMIVCSRYVKRKPRTRRK